MEKKIRLVIKTLFLFILLVSINDIFIGLLPFDYSKISYTSKIIINFIGNILYLIIIIAIYIKTLKKDFKNYFKNFLDNFEQSFKYYLVGLIVMLISNIIIVIITKGNIAGNEQAVRNLISHAPLYMIFSVSIFAPITEELIFRKSIRDIINNKYAYILISGILFGFMHIVGNATTPLEYLYTISYSSLGITFAYTYYKTNNIFSSIMLHCMHNSVAIILYLIAGV